MNKRQLGTEKETLAIEYLQQQGYEILTKNYRCRLGEIDIIAKDGKAYVFIEVKYRSTDKMGHPLEAVDLRKQQKIRTVSQWYLNEQRINDVPIRFDVVGILGTQIVLIKNAF